MIEPEAEDALIISQSARRQLPSVGMIAALVAIYVLLGLFGVIARWLMWAGIVVFGVISLIGLYGAARAPGRSWELRLDADGVTVRGQPTRPWSDFAEVRVTGMRPRWFFFVSLGYRVVAFIGQPGVELAHLPSARHLRGSARLQQRWYGTRLLLMPQAFDASTETIVDAVRRFSDVPVHGS